MAPDINAIIEAANRLSPEQRAELLRRLSLSLVGEKSPGLVERHFGSIDSGDPNSCDNEKIDADLAAEYADTHDYEN